MKFITQSLIKLPTPSNLNYLWNLGFLLGVMMAWQVLTGLFLSFQYCPSSEGAFLSLIRIQREVNFGWVIQLIHMNTASFLFILIYFHIARAVIFSLFLNSSVWGSGLIILLVLMITAFLGYVLPWGQMSFWGATVITNLLSSIPYLGVTLVYWIWGGFSVEGATLNRFFSLHFLLPFLILVLIIVHLLLLHQTGSSNPLGINSNFDSSPFHPFFWVKDLVSLGYFFSLSILMLLLFPMWLSDPENFNSANPLVTPVHIQPEWYFLFAYAILRSIPNKLGGVMALVASIVVFFILPFSSGSVNHKFSPVKSLFSWVLFNTFLILTWIGSCPVEEPMITIGQWFSGLYFLSVFWLIL